MATCVGAAGEGAMKWRSNRLLLSTTQRERMTKVTEGAMSNGWSGVAAAGESRQSGGAMAPQSSRSHAHACFCLL